MHHYPTDTDLGEFDPPLGSGADIGITFGFPRMAGLMSMHASHRRRFVMVAPNSNAIPASMLRVIMDSGSDILTPSAWGASMIRGVLEESVLDGERPEVMVLPHGVGPEFNPARAPARSPSASSMTPFKALHITSTASSRKSTYETSYAFHRLVACGDLPKGSLLTVSADIASAPHWSNKLRDMEGVEVTPGKNKAWGDMADYYRSFDAVVQPSRAEGFGLCMKKGTMVTTPIGQVKVEDIATGHRVLTADGTWGQVVATASRKTRKVCRIVANGVPDLLLTKEHPVLAVRRIEGKQAAFEAKQREARWVNAGDLRPGEDYLVLRAPVRAEPPPPVNISSYVKSPRYRKEADGRVFFQSAFTNHAKAWLPASIPWDVNLCRLLGYYAAEGSSLAGKHGAMWSFDSDDRDSVAREQVRAALSAIGLSATSQRKRGTRGENLVCCNTALARWLSEACGTGAIHKRLPHGIWGLTTACKAALLEGLYRGDGHNSPGDLRLSTASATLAFQARDLWLSLGIPASVRSKRKPKLKPKSLSVIRIKGKIVHTSKLQYQVSVFGKWYSRACALLGLQVRQRGKTGRVGSEFVKYGDSWLVPVRALTTERTTLTVHDLQVDKETIVAHGVVIHNCPIEAMCAGVPAVATSCTGHLEWADPDSALGLVLVPNGPLADMSEDGEGAEAPEVKWFRIGEAIHFAYEQRNFLMDGAMASAPNLYSAWRWENVVKPWLKEMS